MTVPNPYVAVVDDEASVRIALGRLLRLEDYDVGSFPSGEEFLASLDARQPACVILDVHMPGLSGLDVQARLREKAMAVPIVFITANEQLDLGQAESEAGAVRLLRKPFSNAELLEAIGAALRKRSPGVP